MKRLSCLSLWLLSAVFVSIGLVSFSFAQNMKPAEIQGSEVKIPKDMKKEVQKVTKKTDAVRQPRLDGKYKMKHPDFVVTDLSLDSACRIRGYIQNKGRPVNLESDAARKLLVRVWFDEGERTYQISLGDQYPAGTHLTDSDTEFRRFLAGGGAIFRTFMELRVATTVQAEVDPGNLVPESPAGERNNRFQKQLVPTCKMPQRETQRMDPSALSIAPPGSNMKSVKRPAGQDLPAGMRRIEKPAMRMGADAKKGIPLPVDGSTMVPRIGGHGTGLRFLSPLGGDNYPTGSSIPVRFEYISDTTGVAVLSWTIHAYDRTDGLEGSHTGMLIASDDSMTDDGGNFTISWAEIPDSVLGSHHYRVQVDCLGVVPGADPLVSGNSDSFTIGTLIGSSGGSGTYFDPSPESDGLRVTAPAEGSVAYIGESLAIRFETDSAVPDDAQMESNLEPFGYIDGRTGTGLLAPYPAAGGMGFPVSDSTAAGRYRVHLRVVDASGTELASGYSGAFRLEYRAEAGAAGGLVITGPTAVDWFTPTDGITVSYDPGTCTEVLDYARIILARYDGSDVLMHYVLHEGPLDASGTMHFDFPSGSIEDVEGHRTFWKIKVSACTPGGGCSAPGTSCAAGSDSFRMSL